MDLIEAFEKLRLVARNPSVALANGATTQNDGQNQATLAKQLVDFDDSIETLFTQIGALNLSAQTTSSHISPNAPTNQQHSTNQTYPNSFATSQDCRDNLVQNCSVETIDEEEEDSSSQQSSSGSDCWTQTMTGYSNVLQKMIKKDLSSIIEHIKRLSSIISIGREIETIHKSLCPPDEMQFQNFTSQGHQQALIANINVPYVLSLIDAYNDLFSNDQHLRKLPAIHYYSKCCDNLQDLFYSQKNNAQLFNNPLTNETIIETDNDKTMDESTDAIFSNCDDNWTENKLYVNQNNEI